MADHKDLQGWTFEKWVKDILKPYVPNIKRTDKLATYDLEFEFEGKRYLLECKCCNLFHNKTTKEKIGEISIQRCQLKSLLDLVDRRTEILYIGGVLINPHDVFPSVMDVTSVADFAFKSNAKRSVPIRMINFFRAKSLREWMGELFGIHPSEVIYPKFIIMEE